MSSAALALALGAAVLHAVWNLLLAGSRDVLAATAVALCSSLVVALPFAAATWGIERAAIPWLVASGALELVYFLTLTAAYQRAELSLVYPLARGGAPVLVLLGAVVTGYDPSGSRWPASSPSRPASCSCAACEAATASGSRSGS